MEITKWIDKQLARIGPLFMTKIWIHVKNINCNIFELLKFHNKVTLLSTYNNDNVRYIEMKVV